MKSRTPKNKSTPGQSDQILTVLQKRFAENLQRHRGLTWEKIQARLVAKNDKLHTLTEMEATGGEPDVIGFEPETGEYIFVDCAPESPSGRRSLCYDQAALNSRKEHKPKNSALEMARTMGIQLMNEEQYRVLQKIGEFDLKTSSWVLTPPEIRKRGGALFCDRRYDQVFVYHNGAESYYAARGFRGILKV